jgi:uncharacterized protein
LKRFAKARLPRPNGSRARAWALALAFLLTLGLNSGLLTGCAPAPVRPPGPGPALWLASDADSRVWILGSVHVLPSAMVWRSAQIDAAFREADLLILEVAPEVTGDPAFARAFDQAGRSHTPLAAKLTPTDAARLAQASAVAGVNPQALETLRPWRASLHLGYAFLAKRGAHADAGVEAVLTREAVARRMPIIGLESGADQIGFFAQLTPEVEMGVLRATLDDVIDGQGGLEIIDRLWLSGDVAGLTARLLPDFTKPGEQFYRVFLADRNARWADAIASRMAGKGDVFVAVGAAHLLGPEGLPALLRARGIQVVGPN